MSPVTHLLTGWVLAATTCRERRDRLLVTAASVIPDIDGFGAIPELLTRGSSHPLLWFSQYHHLLHGLPFAIAFSLIAFAFARQQWFTSMFALLAFHLHLIEDLVGARGPDGEHWPLPYLWPFSDAWRWSWAGQWALNSWQNLAITVALLAGCIWIALRGNRTPIEFISPDADAKVVSVLRARFGTAY